MKNIEIIGYLGKDAEAKVFGDRPYAVFNVAVSERVRDKVSQEMVDNTTWFSCYKYGANERLLPYLRKGTKVFVRGAFNVSEYLKDGQTKFGLNINVSELELIGQKAESQQTAAPQQSAPKLQKQAAVPMNDDLPF